MKGRKTYLKLLKTTPKIWDLIEGFKYLNMNLFYFWRFGLPSLTNVIRLKFIRNKKISTGLTGGLDFLILLLFSTDVFIVFPKE